MIVQPINKLPMKRFFLLAALLFVAFTVDAQTRRIAHRSHSGAKNESYRKGEGSYGYFPQKVTVHMESGRDTVVYEWDSLANPNYKRDIYVDTAPRAQFGPRSFAPKEKIREMGTVTGRLVVSGPQ